MKRAEPTNHVDPHMPRAVQALLTAAKTALDVGNIEAALKLLEESSRLLAEACKLANARGHREPIAIRLDRKLRGTEPFVLRVAALVMLVLALWGITKSKTDTPPYPRLTAPCVAFNAGAEEMEDGT